MGAFENLTSNSSTAPLDAIVQGYTDTLGSADVLYVSLILAVVIGIYLKQESLEGAALILFLLSGFGLVSRGVIQHGGVSVVGLYLFLMAVGITFIIAKFYYLKGR